VLALRRSGVLQPGTVGVCTVSTVRAVQYFLGSNRPRASPAERRYLLWSKVLITGTGRTQQVGTYRPARSTGARCRLPALRSAAAFAAVFAAFTPGRRIPVLEPRPRSTLARSALHSAAHLTFPRPAPPLPLVLLRPPTLPRLLDPRIKRPSSLSLPLLSCFVSCPRKQSSIASVVVVAISTKHNIARVWLWSALSPLPVVSSSPVASLPGEPVADIELLLRLLRRRLPFASSSTSACVSSSRRPATPSSALPPGVGAGCL